MKAHYEAVPHDCALYDGELIGDVDLNEPNKVIPHTAPDWFPALARVLMQGHDQAASLEIGSLYQFAGAKGMFFVTHTGHKQILPGDWIVRNKRTGEVYPVPAERFKKKFIIADE